MTFGATTARRAARLLFFAALAALLLFGLTRILAGPTASPALSRSPVLIGEMVADNLTGLTDEHGAHADWIELYNRSSATVDLAGWSLSDDPAVPDKWTFPPFALGPGERIVVFASGRDQRRFSVEDNLLYLHTNFRLDAAGGMVGLYPPTARRYLDAAVLDYGVQFPDRSFGLLEEGAAVYFAAPTPGAANDAATTWAGVTGEVAFSVPRGFHTKPFTVELSIAAPGAAVRYTTDGSEPGPEQGALYAGPLAITNTTTLRAAAVRPGYLTGPTVTHTYLFPEDVAGQPADPPGFPQTWGVYTDWLSGYIVGDPVPADYGMDPRVLDNPAYAGQLDGALAALPTLALSTAVENLDIYTRSMLRGPESERPVSVEYFDPADPGAGFQLNAGLRIHGNGGRREDMPKRSLRLSFRQRYGAAKLAYPLLSGAPDAEYNELVLRAGTHEGYAGLIDMGDHRLDTYTRDEYGRATQAALSGTGAPGRFVHLYLNGLYWGIYNVVERMDRDFMAARYGGAPGEWFVAGDDGPVAGDPSRFDTLRRLADEGGLADPAKYATMLEFIDPVQFSDYILTEWYVGNTDWAASNWYAAVHNPAGRVLFFVWDVEKSLEGQGAVVQFGMDFEPDTHYPNVTKPIFTALMENEEYRLLFADRLLAHISAGGALSDEAAIARWREINAPLAPAVLAESARWGDARNAEPVTPADWQAGVEAVVEQLQGNGVRLLKQARAAGFYPSVDAPALSVPGGVIDGATPLTLSAPYGDIYLTTDGSDPRTPGSGEPAPTAQLYSGETLEAAPGVTVKARVLAATAEGPVWSALAQGVYVGPEQAPLVRIGEIMYHPAAGEHGGEEYEFVEVQNRGDLAADLSYAYFEGIDYHFPAGSVLPPGGVWTLAADYTAFRDRYPDAELFGLYRGRLQNSGETLALRSPEGKALDVVAYRDRDGWPLSADGAGDSLERVDFTADGSDPAAWRASTRLHGAPGE